MKWISFARNHLTSRFFMFEVRSYYRVLRSTTQPPFPWKTIWKLKMPTKVSFFLWTAALGWILTIDNLRRRQVVVVDLYCMCKRGEETIDHLIMHCSIARELWNLVFPLFGVQWRMVELLATWFRKFNKHRSAVIWAMISHCLIFLCGVFYLKGMLVLLKEVRDLFMI